MFKKVTSLLLLATLFLFGVHPASAVTFDFQLITDSEKSWTITFNENVNERADLNSIHIQSANKVEHEVSSVLSDDSTKIIVKPTKPYRFGTEYTLVIPKGLTSVKGTPLKEDVTKSFTLQSTYIDTIETDSTSWLTNVVVQRKSSDVSHMTVSLEGFLEEMTLLRQNNQFSRGIRGLAAGQTVIIRAYDENNQLLETQYYDVK
ncbi:Ig-like domain-containing protein [Sporosarcina sp. FSL K6-3457]|uniref:Ig-like domain-containing protein n=1 Tax=Sporosarcina sp. FSL K6-3457 TaxID=2978204 RepID=UPI0030F8586E